MLKGLMDIGISALVVGSPIALFTLLYCATYNWREDRRIARRLRRR